MKNADNEEAISKNSIFSVEFDPAFQELSIHSIAVWRDGERLDKLNFDGINLLQRETQLENLIYDGRWTASLILDDIRKGDILDYSYSIKGTNPALSNHFSHQFWLEWDVPVLHHYYRLLWPHDRELNVTPVNTSVKIKQSEYSSYTSYVLDLNSTPAIQLDSDTPDWYLPWARVNFSDVSNWGDVVRWALPKYRMELSQSAELTSLVAIIRANNITEKQQVAAVLEYVQNEIRYQGIEIGTSGFQPHPPEVTLKRRYGDCKDKTTLFLAMLRLLDISAYPALVNTSSGKTLNIDAPRVNAFDHVIARVTIDGRHYWLDPTISNQYGGLDKIYQPDYGFALVLVEGGTDLVLMQQEQSGHSLHIKEEFDLRSSIDQAQKYSVYSTYSGAKARDYRRQLNSSGKMQMIKNYLEYYSDYYPTIEADSDVRIQDDKTSGDLYVEEHYNIMNFWEDDKENKRWLGHFYSNLLYPYIRIPDTRRRTSPLSLQHPVDIEQKITVLLSGKWNLSDEDKHVSSPYFDYEKIVRFFPDENKLVLKYEYKSITDYVPVEDIDEYIVSIEEVKKDLDFSFFTYYESNAKLISDTSDQPVTDEESGVTEDQAMAVIVGVFVLMLIYVHVEYRFNQRNAPADADDVPYYPVSSFKFLVLSLISLGLYFVFWFYKNWEYVKYRERSTILPWGRAVFCTFWYYSLYKSIEKDPRFSETSLKVANGSVILILAIMFFIGNLISSIESIYSYIGLLASIIIALPLVERINTFTRHDNEHYIFNSRWRPRHIVIGLFFGTIVAYSVALETYLIPTNSVISGSDIWEHDVNYMRRIEVIEPGEDIEYFYSSGFLSNRTDGNGFTQSRVFSYWKNDSTQNFQKETAMFSEISDIVYTYNKDDNEDTIAKIVRSDGSYFLLFIAPENSKGRVFTNRLNEVWRQHK